MKNIKIILSIVYKIGFLMLLIYCPKYLNYMFKDYISLWSNIISSSLLEKNKVKAMYYLKKMN